MASIQPPLQLALNLPARPNEPPDSYWRSLAYFNGYRFIVALLLLTVTAVFGNSLAFGAMDFELFVYVSAAYVMFSAVCFLPIASRRRFHLQLSLQVSADILIIVVLMFASGGISSGLGLLLLSGLAAAGLISRGRWTLFYAALASIAVLLEHTVQVLFYFGITTQYVQAGLLSIGYFTTAWVAHTLAKYLVATEQLAAQREIDLANMAEVSQLVIQDMQDGVLVVDERGIIRQYNVRAEAMLGALRRQSRELSLKQYSPVLAQRLQAWRKNPVAGFDPMSTVVLNNKVSARFMPVGRSRKVGAVIFLEDQTRVQVQARQMKLAALGRLTANIAHEIRNPLSAISHATELLQEEPAVNDTVARLLNIIHDNSQRLDRMVNDVLKLNRADRAHREVFRLGDYLKTFTEQFCQIEKVSQALVRLELNADPEVSFDHSHLNQVMWNLCRNALRHCRRQNGSIRIAVSEVSSRNTVKLDVVDDGPGVPPALRNQLFEPFFTTVGSGTGLGLYIAREVCEANDATLDYVETPSGAQFTILCRGAGSF
ncbi:MAG: two-component sensor histidine kinase [Betaproteobacteria bacterium]|nr:two-component sensor histidine kinase [Betaproteobacteria bacterium]